MGQLTLAFEGSAEINSTHEVAPRRARNTKTVSHKTTDIDVPEPVKLGRKVIGIINAMPKYELPLREHVYILIDALVEWKRYEDSRAVWNAMRKPQYERIPDIHELGRRIANKCDEYREILEILMTGKEMKGAIQEFHDRHYSGR